MKGSFSGIWALRSLRSLFGQDDESAAQSELPENSVHGEMVTVAWMFAETDFLKGQIPEQGMYIHTPSFRVGRCPEYYESRPSKKMDLQLNDAYPFQLSRNHFMVNYSKAAVIVTDCGSHFGTLVNGIKLATGVKNEKAVLLPGYNQVIAGQENSKFRFSIIIEQMTVEEKAALCN